MAFSKERRRAKIKMRVRKKVEGSSEVPRLTVYRSNKEIYAQIIDDSTGKTLAAVGSLKGKDTKGKPKVEQAQAIGKRIAEVAKEAGIERVRFDRNGYLYHGRVKSLAEGAREGGLNF